MADRGKKDWIKMEFERSRGSVVEVTRQWKGSNEGKRLERVDEWIRYISLG